MAFGALVLNRGGLICPFYVPVALHLRSIVLMPVHGKVEFQVTLHHIIDNPEDRQSTPFGSGVTYHISYPRSGAELSQPWPANLSTTTEA